MFCFDLLTASRRRSTEGGRKRWLGGSLPIKNPRKSGRILKSLYQPHQKMMEKGRDLINTFWVTFPLPLTFMYYPYNLDSLHVHGEGGCSNASLLKVKYFVILIVFWNILLRYWQLFSIYIIIKNEWENLHVWSKLKVQGCIAALLRPLKEGLTLIKCRF